MLFSKSKEAYTNNITEEKNVNTAVTKMNLKPRMQEQEKNKNKN